ncbi:MAG TPA: autotransporter-associated beta strand repeat-containing protein [Chthoniobacterales bacterium]|nr:autotransporter-associated beta strand repeat-containing protein [Chthoniobacterales bacterium]
MSFHRPPGIGFAWAPIRVALLFCALIFALPAKAGTTWDGGGANASWGTANNWTGNALPVFDGTQTITIGTGFASGLTMTLDGTRYINDLVINTTSGFTLAAGTGGTLNLRSGNITRNDIAGTEATQTISAGMILGDPTGVAAYTGIWNIAGSNSLNITGNIAEAGGSRSITKTGLGTVILSGTNTFSGGLTLNAGIVSISSNSNLGASSGGLIFNGGTLQVTQDVMGTRNITMTGAGTFDVAIGKTIEQSGLITGNGALTLTSFGTLILSGSGSNGTGATNVGGVLSIRGTVTLGTGNFAFNTGILELGNGNFTRALGTGANQVNMTNSSGFAAYGADRVVNLGGSGATVTWGAVNFLSAANAVFYLGDATADHTVDFQNGINLNGGTRSFQTLRGVGSVPEAKISGVISGTGASNFSLDGVSTYAAGSLILSNGNNSYAGTTTINAGNLLLTANATGTAGNTVLGSGSSDILLGNTSGAFDAGLFTNAAVTISRNIRAQSGNTGVITLGGYSASASTFSGNIFLGTNSGVGKSITLTAASGGTTTFSGVIQDPTGVSGAGLLRKSGVGTVVLSGVNTYAGGTSIDAGTLSISQSANLGANSGGLTLNAGTLEITSGFSTNRAFTLTNTASTFQIDPFQTFTITSAITGNGTLNKTGTGTMVLGGNNSFTGGTNVSAGILQLAASERLLDSGNLTVSGGTFDLQAFNETLNIITLTSGSIIGSGTLTGADYQFQSGTVSARLGGTAGITKTTSGTVILSGANTFTGATTISSGLLQLNTNNALGTVAGGTTVSNGAALNLNNVNYSTAETVTLNGTGISNGGALTNTGTSTFAGLLDIATNASISAGGGTLNLTGGILKNGTTLTFLGGGTVNITNNGITGSSPNSDLVIDGTTVVLGAVSSYNGATTVQNSGTLKLAGNNRLPSAPQTALTLNTSGVFDMAGFSDGIASLSGDSSGKVKNSSVGGTSLLTVNPGVGVTSTFAGTISGTNGGTQGDVALRKSGAGTLILTGANTFSGATTVNAGSLVAAATVGSALASTASITINSGGTLFLGKNDQINNAATMILAGGTFAKGNFSEGTTSSLGVGALTLAASNSHLDFGTGTVGALTFASFTPGAYTLTIDNWTGTALTQGNNSTDRLIFASDQSANLSSFLFTGFGPGGMEIDLGGGYYEVVPAPEPATFVSGGMVFALLFFRHRKQIRRLFQRA